MTDGRRQTADDGRQTTDDAHRTTEDGGVGRRDVVKLLATASLAAVGIGAPEVAHAWERTNAALARQGTGTQFAPAFFTPDEWRTVRSLVDVVIPRDDRSGSATDAGVPEFMDFMMVENPTSQPWMRDGLKWLGDECRKRFGREWTASSAAQHRQLLNVIAFPKTAPAALKAGVEFFSRFRDLTSSGFWTSRMGVKDLGYQGNVTVPVWSGCPEPALTKLGVSYNIPMHVPRRG